MNSFHFQETSMNTDSNMNCCVKCQGDLTDLSREYEFLGANANLFTKNKISIKQESEHKICTQCVKTLKKKNKSKLRCVCCKSLIEDSPTQFILHGPRRTQIELMIYPRKILPDSQVCYTCWHKAGRELKLKKKRKTAKVLSKLDVHYQESECEFLIIEDNPTTTKDLNDTVIHSAACHEYEQIREDLDETNKMQQKDITNSQSEIFEDIEILEDNYVNCDLSSSTYNNIDLDDSNTVTKAKIVPETVSTQATINSISGELTGIPANYWSDFYKAYLPDSKQSILIYVNGEAMEFINFKCSGNNQSRCFVHGCREPERLRIPSYMRKRLLMDYSYYTRSKARICREHIFTYDWDCLKEYSYVNNHIAKNEIEDITYLITEPETPILQIAFENTNKLTDSLCHYFIGTSKSDFLELLLTTPELNIYENRAMLLAIYLTKLRTGESNSKIGKLFNKTENFINTAINKVYDCLNTIIIYNE